ncbi:sugar kinase [Frondihabitans sucicola]|uniref:sugar kinase n=1 Tax=Frondihabitans sucicola TaxID=1268041 RepID=UPI0025730BC7|nr:sugar kinase [Frondihabitans sucicola]
MNSAKVASVGEALTVLVPRVPGALESSETFVRSVGGAELNVAVGLASRGVPAALLTRVGDDGFGRHLVAEAAEHGVDVSAVEIDPVRPTGLYVKEVGAGSPHPFDLGAARSRMHYYRAGSAGSALSPAYLRRPEVRAVLDAVELVHLTGITPALSASAYELCLAVMAEPRVGGRRVSFDLNWRPALWAGREAEGVRALDTLSRAADVVLLGVSEARTVFGTDDPAELRAELREPRILVLKNDENAATAFDGETRFDVPALTVDVVEAIGAGDAFAAGFLGALVSGRDVRTAVEEAHRLAVVALSSHGDHVGAAPTAP